MIMDASGGPLMLPRLRFDPRRLHISAEFDWNGSRILIAAGFHPDGIVREIFGSALPTGIDKKNGIRPGSDADRVMGENCILVSMLLQCGHRCHDLLAKLMRSSSDDAMAAFRVAETGITKPSLTTALLREAIEIERGYGGYIREIYGAPAPALQVPTSATTGEDASR